VVEFAEAFARSVYAAVMIAVLAEVDVEPHVQIYHFVTTHHVEAIVFSGVDADLIADCEWVTK
jgi:hypothetical protein